MKDLKSIAEAYVKMKMGDVVNETKEIDSKKAVEETIDLLHRTIPGLFPPDDGWKYEVKDDSKIADGVTLVLYNTQSGSVSRPETSNSYSIFSIVFEAMRTTAPPSRFAARTWTMVEGPFRYTPLFNPRTVKHANTHFLKWISDHVDRYYQIEGIPN